MKKITFYEAIKLSKGILKLYFNLVFNQLKIKYCIMKTFNIEEIVLKEFDNFEDLPKINQSDCDDFLSQFVFWKIDNFAFKACASMHNMISDKRDTLPFLFICTSDEISSPQNDNPENTIRILDNTAKLFTPPNKDFNQVVTRKSFPKKGKSEGNDITIHFNPYFLSLTISVLFFHFSTDKRVIMWCQQKKMKMESIEKILKILEDKYSYRFVDLLIITNKVFTEIYSNIPSSEKLRRIETFIGTTGTDLVHQYITMILNYYEENLIPAVQNLFGHLKYD